MGSNPTLSAKNDEAQVINSLGLFSFSIGALFPGVFLGVRLPTFPALADLLGLSRDTVNRGPQIARARPPAMGRLPPRIDEVGVAGVTGVAA